MALRISRIALAILCGGGVGTGAFAGDRIIIGNSQVPAEPAKENSFSKQSFKLWTKSPDVGSTMAVTPSMPPPSSKQDKRSLRNPDPQRWWLVVGPEDEEKTSAMTIFGVPGDEQDSSEALSRPGDHTFYKLHKDGAKPVSASRQYSDRDEERAKKPDEADKREGRRFLLTEPGAHTRREFELKPWFSNAEKSAQGDSENTLHELLREISVPTPAQQIRPWENPRSQSIGAELPGVRQGWDDPINLGRDDTSQAAHPVLPRLVSPTAATRRPDLLGTLPSPSTGPAIPFASSIPEFNGGGLLAPAPSQPSPQRVLNDPRFSLPSVMGGSLFNRDVPQRGGL